MPWCPHCSDDHPTASSAAQLMMIPSSPDPDPDGSRGRRFTSCSACGRVLKDRPLASLPQLHQKALSAIATCALNLNLNLTGDNAAIIISDAHRLFRTALDKEELFARSRRTRNNAASACLYLALRRHRKPYMLIHLSDYLRVTVYVLGGTLLALSTILKLSDDAEEELSLYPNSSSSSSSSSSFIDPSLFMHRISSRLLGRKDTEVAATALRILSGTKKPREWMLSKQKQIPIRYCTAALYIAAIARQEEDEVKFSKSEVAAAVCAEFESTEQLSMEEFVSRAAIGSNLPSNEELVCEHRKSDRAHCCYGLCRECYDVFIDISSQGGCMMISEQPAFQQNDLKRQKIIKCKKESVSTLSDVDEDDDISVYLNTEREKQYKTMIWELMHKEYLEEQAAKNAAAGTSIDGVKPRKERRKQTRAGDRGSNSNTAAAANKDKMKKNQLSSRINYDVLSQMYADEKQLTTETNIGAVTDEQDNKKNKEFEIEAMEDYKEAEVYEENNSTEAEHNDYVGDEDYGEGGEYNEYYADGNEDYADDDFGF